MEASKGTPDAEPPLQPTSSLRPAPHLLVKAHLTLTLTQDGARRVVVPFHTNKLYHKPLLRLLKNVPLLLVHLLLMAILTNRDGWIPLLDRERWAVGRVLERVCWSA